MPGAPRQSLFSTSCRTGSRDASITIRFVRSVPAGHVPGRANDRPTPQRTPGPFRELDGLIRFMAVRLRPGPAAGQCGTIKIHDGAAHFVHRCHRVSRLVLRKARDTDREGIVEVLTDP